LIFEMATTGATGGISIKFCCYMQTTWNDNVKSVIKWHLYKIWHGRWLLHWFFLFLEWLQLKIHLCDQRQILQHQIFHGILTLPVFPTWIYED
jgi:hypothetical protein